MHNPFTIFDDKSWQFKMIERFIIVLLNRVSTHENVNEARREIETLKTFHQHRTY